MRLQLVLSALLWAFVASNLSAADAAAKIKVLLITGGHAFEEKEFFKVFQADANIAFTHAAHGKDSATAWERDDLAGFDVVALYDMPMNLTDAQKARFLSLFERGTGLVVLHHALVSFQDWPDYERIIGGRYPKPPKGQPQVTDKVGYQHDVDFQVVVTDKAHPITKGLKDFSIHDEIYWGFRVGADVHPLLTTTHEKSGKLLMWTRTEKKSRVAYLQLGHDHSAFENPNYRELVTRAIQWAALKPAQSAAAKLPTAPKPRITFPDAEKLTIDGHPAFLFSPPSAKCAKPQPWIFYGATLPQYPDESERWMHEQFLAAGIAVAGVDVGEAFGSPKSHVVFDALYRELTEKRGFAAKPCLFGRSRGGLWVSSWALTNPARIAGLIGIYPVFDFRTYPGLKRAAPAYDLTPEQLEARAEEFNPIERIGTLAKAGVPAALIHGDVDKVVPLKENSAEFVRRYREAGAESLAKLIVLEGQGHNFFEGFFHSQELVDLAIKQARAGARK